MKKLHFRYEMHLKLGQEVWDHHFLIRLKPMEAAGQRLESFLWGIEPADVVGEVVDGFGNHGFAGSCRGLHDSLSVWSEGDVLVEAAGDGICHPMYRFQTAHTMPDAEIEGFLREAETLWGAPVGTREGLEFLMNRLHGRFVYVPGVTTVKTTAAEAFRGGQGVCQDYAHIFIGLCRLAGVPARYAAGMMLGEGATHAWAEVWLDGRFVGMDPTNNRLVDETYIKLSHGRDFVDSTIDRGCFHGFAVQEQQISVKVEETT